MRDGGSFEEFPAQSIEFLGTGLDVVRRAHPDAVLVAAPTAFFPYRKTIVTFMAENRLPAIYGFSKFVETVGVRSVIRPISTICSARQQAMPTKY